MSRAWRVRPETAGDVDAVRAVHVAAFPSTVESRLVDVLRAADKAVISLVAEDGKDIIGHVLFSEVALLGEPDYYHRFGFATATGFGLANEYGVGAEFMAVALHPDGLRGASGLVSYQPEFGLVAP